MSEENREDEPATVSAVGSDGVVLPNQDDETDTAGPPHSAERSGCDRDSWSFQTAKKRTAEMSNARLREELQGVIDRLLKINKPGSAAVVAVYAKRFRKAAP